MPKPLYLLLLLVLVVTVLLPTPVTAAGPQWVVVNYGDTLYSIASRYGTTVGVLMQANQLPDPNFVYAGQRLLVPASASAPAPSAPAGSTSPKPIATTYTVHAGETLYSIAARFGLSVSALASANRLWNYDFIYTGQVLKIPGTQPAPAKPAPAPTKPAPSNPAPNNPAPTNPTPSNPAPSNPAPNPPANAPTEGKWIDVNISKQTITAYEGANPVKSVLVSTGIAVHPTVVGRYKIYSKYSAYTMSGGTPGVDYYYLPNVPWTMFFYQGYAIHGTYWHHNFGHRMSHGCVNLSIADAKWFYDWAPVGTPVISHY